MIIIGHIRGIGLEIIQFIVFDESIAALDVSVQAQIVNLLIGLREEIGLTFLFISHDLSMVKYISHRIAVMYCGNIVEIADAAQIYHAPKHPYTQHLIDAIPIPDPILEKRRPEPSPLELEPTEPEDLIEASPGHFVVKSFA